MIDIDKDNGLVLTIAILAVLLGVWLGASFGSYLESQKAIKAGAAYYSVNPTTGEISFNYRTNFVK